ncbi:MAG: hypothetical protein ABSG71_10745 [Thermodesulfobacteriota bacterium]
MAVNPKNAATVILLRDKKPQGFEIFFLKRHEKSSFMGGNFVYPGGRVDQDDGSLKICTLSKGITFEEAQKIFGGTFSPEESFAHWIAGIRELFEEAGVLLAYDQKGSLFRLRNQDEREKFLHYRESLQKGDMLIGLHQRLDLNGLIPVSFWHVILWDRKQVMIRRRRRLESG